MSAEFYHSFCAENQLKTNPHVSEVLEKTSTTESYTLKLAGNNRLRPVQRLDDKDIFALSRCLQSNQNLTGLDLSYNNITDEGIRHLSELLQEENSTLSSLDLRFNDIGANGAQLLSQRMKSNFTLLSLTLSGNKVGKEGAMHLANLLQVNNKLQVLRLANCDLDTQSVIAFAIALKTNQTLRCLDISRALLFGHQEEWAVHFAQMLAVNQSLVELHLGTMGIASTGMEKLSKGLLFNHSLRYLDLRCNCVTRDDVLPLADLLSKESTTLEVLDLSSNQIKDEGAVYLSEAIASPNCSLKELSLCSNSISTEGLMSLAKALALNTTLTHIYIWGNHFEEPVCLAFRDLIQNGRLHSDHTDVSTYEVDGHVFLAQVFHSLGRQYYQPENNISTINNKTESDLSSNSVNSISPMGMRFFV